nr:MAG TPA: minor tail protein [Caudoviricetes sp.]
MDDNIIDTLKIEVVADSGKAVDGIGKLISVLEKIKNATSGGSKGLNSVSKNLSKISDAVSKINSGSTSKLRDLADGLKSLSGVGNIKMGKTADRIADLGAAVDLLKDVDFSKLTELSNGLRALENAGNVKVPRFNNASSPVSAPPTPASSAYDGNEVIPPTVVTGAAESFAEYNEQLDKAISRSENLKKAASAASTKISKQKSLAQSLGSVAEKSLKKVSNLLTMMSKRAMYRLLNAGITAVTSSFKAGVDAVYQYSKALNGILAKSLDSIATSIDYLKRSLGAMSAPLINMFAPAIDEIVDKFVDLLNIANQVFARFSGATTWTRATKVATEYAEATDAATAANKALKKSILGIDELNVLADNSSNDNSGAGASGVSNFAFEEVPLDTTYIDGVIDKLKDILWYVGAITLGFKSWDISHALSQFKALSGIKSFALTAGLMLSVTGLVIMVKGMIDIVANGINVQNFMESLGGGGAIVAGGALIGAAFGNAILGAAIGAIIAGIPMYIVGIWDAIQNGLNWLNAALIGAGATLTGAGIGAIIGMVGGPIGAGIGALIGLAVGALTDLTILIAQNWDSIVERCSQALSDIGQFFVDIWDDICEIWSVCAEWFDTHVIQPVAGFFSGLWAGISSAASTCWEAIVGFFAPAIEWFSELFGSIYQTVSDVFYNIGVIIGGCCEIIKKLWEPIGRFFSGLWADVTEFAVGAWESIKSVFLTIGSWITKNVINPIGKLFSDVWKKLIGGAAKAWAGVKKVFGTVASFFSKTFSAAWEGIVKIFSVAGDIFVDIKDGIVTAFKAIVNGLIKGINKVVSIPFEGINAALEKIRDIEILNISPFSGLKTINIPQIPLLAGGGMVNAGTAFIAGEAGAEVVANIGNRTGVMNTDEMQESVARGVADANAEQNALLREEISILRKLLDKDTNVTAYVGTGSLISGLERKNRRDGKTVVPVGV